ncbi:hypothetical protein PVAND_016307 [Polypedilum vanderplanki]|uniref:F-box domain-containing protein n=1 Tax=Polypedilum vanderplanki TaxID=319348 RepID=A0A9J6BFU8_POLVA|nr:hypothetical protein PVAND_016307 [Polypedilum vanderplanki]
METLPEDVLIEIFNYLSSKDVLASTLVCKRFNDIISNSITLLNKFEVNFNRKKINNEWIGSRNYQKIKIEPQAFLHFLPIVKTIINDVTTLSLATIFSNQPGKWPPDENDIKELLLMTKNLKNLKVKFSRVKIKQNKDKIKLKLNLDSLKIIGGDEFLLLFHDCQVKKFSFTTFNYNVSNELKKFLLNQENLEYFDMSSVSCGLFQDNFLLTAKFQLKKIKFGQIPDDEKEIFIKFLIKHEKTLKEFEMNSCDDKIVEILSKFKNLKCLTINSERKIFPDVKMDNIEKLTILQCANFNCDWSEKFPNLIELKLVGPKECEGLKKLNKLRTLEIHRAVDIPQIEIPQVKKLILNDVKCQKFPSPFNFETQNLEELFVVKNPNEICTWLVAFKNGGYGKNLKVFSESFEK